MSSPNPISPLPPPPPTIPAIDRNALIDEMRKTFQSVMADYIRTEEGLTWLAALLNRDSDTSGQIWFVSELGPRLDFHEALDGD